MTNDEKKIIRFFLGLTLLVSGSIYLYTCAPTVTFGDSGDFITAANGLRFAHPPGYPTYIIMTKLFTFLPLGHDIGYRVNLLSVFFAALTVSMSYLFSYYLMRWYCVPSNNNGNKNSIILHLGSMAGALVLTFTGTFWSQALIAKVHPLSSFLSIIIFFLIILFVRTGEFRLWYTAVLLWGLSLCNHQTSLLYAPMAILYLSLAKRLKLILDIRVIVNTITMGMIGFMIILFLPLVSMHLNIIEWGSAEHWKGFKEILLRSDYGPFEIGRSWPLIQEQLGTAVWVLLTGQSTTILGLFFGILIGLCALFGWNWLFMREKPLAIFLAGIALIVWLFFGIVSNHPMTSQLSVETRDVFFIPAYMVYSICAGLGIARIGLSFSRRRSFYLYGWMFASLVIPGIGCIVQFPKHNEHSYYLAYDFGKNILDTMQPHSIFIGDDDLHVFPVWYLQQVERYRTDVLILSRTSLYKKWYYKGLEKSNIPDFQLPSFDEKMVPKDMAGGQAFLDSQMFHLFSLNLKSRPCYFYQKYPLRVNPPFPLTQVGLVYQVTEMPYANTISIIPFPYISPPVEYHYRISPQDIYQKDYWRFWATERLGDYRYNQGMVAFQKKDLKKAETELIKSIQLNPENIYAHYQLGVLYQMTGNTKSAYESFVRVMALNPTFQDITTHIESLQSLLEK